MSRLRLFLGVSCAARWLVKRTNEKEILLIHDQHNTQQTGHKATPRSLLSHFIAFLLRFLLTVPTLEASAQAVGRAEEKILEIFRISWALFCWELRSLWSLGKVTKINIHYCRFVREKRRTVMWWNFDDFSLALSAYYDNSSSFSGNFTTPFSLPDALTSCHSTLDKHFPEAKLA